MSGNCFLVLLFFDFAMCFGSPVPGGRALLILHLLYHTDAEFSSLARGRTKFSADGKSAPETGGKVLNKNARIVRIDKKSAPGRDRLCFYSIDFRRETR